jgi:hypothetical protein
VKALLLALLVGLRAFAVQAQGIINLSTSAAQNTKFIVNAATGERVDGTVYWAQLYWANGVVTDEALLQSANGGPVHPRTGRAAGVLPSLRVLLNVTPSGGIATVQVRAWSSSLGADWDMAYAMWLAQPSAPDRVLGKTLLFQIDTWGGFEPFGPPTVAGLFPGLLLYPVPEPSVLALCVLTGLLATLGQRRLACREK